MVPVPGDLGDRTGDPGLDPFLELVGGGGHGLSVARAGRYTE
jgi:hypothetical protein